MGTAGRFRFTRDNRLLNAADFSRVFDRARRSQDRYFTVLCRDSQQDEPRLGLAISKKHCKRAFRRNLIKRIVRESFRHNKHAFRGLDFVVINKPASTMATRQQLFSSLDAHWARLGKGPSGDG